MKRPVCRCPQASKSSCAILVEMDRVLNSDPMLQTMPLFQSSNLFLHFYPLQFCSVCIRRRRINVTHIGMDSASSTLVLLAACDLSNSFLTKSPKRQFSHECHQKMWV
jgi:hypothetical protein